MGVTMQGVTGIAINEISGAVIEKRPYSKPPMSELPMDAGRSGYSEGWDNAVDNQGQVRLDIDREKLASILYLEKCDPQSLSLTDTDKVMIMEECYREADAIRSQLKDIIVVVK